MGLCWKNLGLLYVETETSMLEAPSLSVPSTQQLANILQDDISFSISTLGIVLGKVLAET